MKMSDQHSGVLFSLLLHGSCVFLLLVMGNQMASLGGSTLAIDFSIVSSVARLSAVAQKPLTPVRENEVVPVSQPQRKKTVQRIVEPSPEPSVARDPEPLVAKEELEEEVTAIEEAFVEPVETDEEIGRPPMEVVADAEPPADKAEPVAPLVAGGAEAVDVDAAAITKRPSPAELYLKSHFLYIKEGVQNSISYPLIARRMGWEGRVVVCFVVCADGTVTDITVVESSGFAVLDKNAVATIRQAAPFPKPPVRAKLTMPISFRLG